MNTETIFRLCACTRVCGPLARLEMQRLRISTASPRPEPPTQMCRKRAHLDALLAFSSEGRLAETACQGEPAPGGLRDGAGQLHGESQTAPVPSGLPPGAGAPRRPAWRHILPPAARISAFVPKGIYLRFSPTVCVSLSVKEDILYVLKRSRKNNLAYFFHV